MRKGLALFLLFLPALAQVGLRDGPRPSTEVRGYLEGNAQEGYRVRVEFLLETGANPTQGTTYQSLTWNGRLYLCVGRCDTFSLQGFSPGTYPSGQVYDLYDSQGKLRGKAGVTTVYSGTQPQYYRVEYAVWPLQGTKTWQASPDNPVPMETGGWLTARPPGGSPERYRYPGMESYRPPSGGSIFAGISPQDRDLAQKSLIDSMAKLRAFYGRLVRGSELWFFVPEVSPWTFQLAQEYQARVGGGVRYVVPEGTATSYCPTSYRNDTRFYVLPRPSLDKKDALAVIWPPQNASQKGAAMAGRYLVDRPDWPDGSDCLGQVLNLVPTTSGLPEARAYLYGCISQANLKAQVQFKEMTLGQPTLVWRWQGWNWSYIYSYGKDWDGRATFDLGNGNEEVRITLPSPAPTDWTRVEPVRDAQDRNRGYAYVKATVERTLDTSNSTSLTYKDQRTAPWDFSFQHGGGNLHPVVEGPLGATEPLRQKLQLLLQPQLSPHVRGAGRAEPGAGKRHREQADGLGGAVDSLHPGAVLRLRHHPARLEGERNRLAGVLVPLPLADHLAGGHGQRPARGGGRVCDGGREAVPHPWPRGVPEPHGEGDRGGRGGPLCYLHHP